MSDGVSLIIIAVRWCKISKISVAEKEKTVINVIFSVIFAVF